MKLRYRKSATFYIPQYLSEKYEWEDFTADQISGSLRKLCEKIGILSFPMSWNGQWYFHDNGKDKGNGLLIFSNEMYVMAFLGAAKSYFNQETKEFNID